MRFHFGPVPQPESAEPPPSVWIPLRHDFGPGVMQLFALPIGGLALVLVGWLWIHATPVMKHLGGYPGALIFMLIAAMLVLILIHELLHAAVHPERGMSRKTVLGVWPSRLVFYAHYDGPRSRERLVLAVAMPFLVMTLLPLAIGIASGHATITLAFLSSLNALAAGGDLFAIGLLLWQIPRHANVFNQGWRTYWGSALTIIKEDKLWRGGS
jgi:hypothetical protein